ncbi:MAG: hypothetical protein ACHQ6T_16300 [Myxococcota bacterium]
MTRMGTLGLRLGLSLLPAYALAQDSGDLALEQLAVESASTPQQHLALAKYQHGKAAAERAQAKHESLASK